MTSDTNKASSSQKNNVATMPWEAFVTAKTSNELCSAWLSLLCEQISGMRLAAVLVEGQEAQTYVPMAVWPEANPNMSRLAKVVETSLRERRGVVQTAPPEQLNDADSSLQNLSPLTQLSYPLILEQRVVAVVCMEVDCAHHDVNHIFRQIYWGSAWLTSLFAGRALQEAVIARARASSVLELLAIALRHGKLQQALFETVNELRQRLDCAKTAIGLVNHANIKLVALSEAATFEKHTTLSKAYLHAMEEVHDIGKLIQYDDATPNLNYPMHQALAQISGADSIVSCPLFEGGRVIGALVLERTAKGFDTSDVVLVESFSEMVAPIIAQRKEAEKSSIARLLDEGKSVLAKLFGPKHLIWKTAALAFILLVLVLKFVQIEYRVTAKTVIEGEVQRAISAPFDGFVKESFVRAGDTVKQGQLLASLDERDLLIEKSRWSSERDQYENRLRESMATHDLVSIQVLSAQLNQAEAELNLVNKKIGYSKLIAPFDGLVVSGDLSQQISAPIEVGKKLFEIAPLSSYRVILQVDEREIRHIKIAQSGQLVVTGIAGEPIPLKIQKITPVATAQDGRNFFRVEAHIAEASKRLRPGMEGVGKIETGRRSLWWILMHSFTDWLRLSLWNYMP